MTILLIIWSLVAPLARPNFRQAIPVPQETQLTILGVTLGTDTLASVQKKLGPSKECAVSEHLELLAYGVGQQILLFESSDVGAGDITGFTLETSKAPTKCPLASATIKVKEVRTLGGVYLGMSQQNFIRIFGMPKKKTPRGNWYYQWLRTEKLSESKQRMLAKSSPELKGVSSVDILTTVEARFSQSGLIYFYASKIKTL